MLPYDIRKVHEVVDPAIPLLNETEKVELLVFIEGVYERYKQEHYGMEDEE